MTKTKITKKPRHGQYSSKIHTPKHRTNFYASPFAKKVILTVIMLAVAIIIGTVACIQFLTPESRIKSQIEPLAADYYENYLYQNLINSDKYQALPDKTSAMEKYTSSGFNPITLRNLLLHNNHKNDDFTNFIANYCDLDATTIKYYPESPFNQNSYRTEIKYSCNF